MAVDIDAPRTGRWVLLGLICAVALVFTAALVAYVESDDGLVVRDLPTMTAEAGDVTIRVTPQRIGDEEAVFAVSFASQTSRLDFAPDTVAQLMVDGKDWRPATWDAEVRNPTGLEGRLEFRALGPVDHRAELRIDVLGTLVTLAWPL